MTWEETIRRLIDLEEEWTEETIVLGPGHNAILAHIDDLSDLIDDMLDESRRYPDEPRQKVLDRI